MLLCSREHIIAVIYALPKVCTVLYSAIKQWLVSSPLGCCATAEGWQRGKMKAWLSLCDDAELCYCHGVSSSAAWLGTLEWLCHCFAQLPLMTIPRARSLFDMHLESGGTGNKRTIPGAVTVALLKFFSTFTDSQPSAASPAAHSAMQNLSPFRNSAPWGGQGQWVHSWPPVHCVCLQDRPRPSAKLQREGE